MNMNPVHIGVLQHLRFDGSRKSMHHKCIGCLSVILSVVHHGVNVMYGWLILCTPSIDKQNNLFTNCLFAISQSSECEIQVIAGGV